LFVSGEDQHFILQVRVQKRAVQVDFPVGQVTSHFHLPDGHGTRQDVCQQSKKPGLTKGDKHLRIILFV